MSWEGYEQVICAAGHYSCRDGWESDNCHCGAKIVWFNVVDQTNGPSQGEIPIEDLAQFIVEPEKTETCPCCGHTKKIQDAKYRIPTKEETEKLRKYYSEEL